MEVGYAFSKQPNKIYQTQIFIVIQASIFASFAETGNPNNPELKNTNWDEIKGKPWMCLDICANTKVIKLPETENLAVWDSMYNDSKTDLI